MGKNYKGITFKIVFQKKKGFIRKMKLQMQAIVQNPKKNKKDQNRNSEVKSVVIIGDSIIERQNGWDMSKKVY